MYCRGAVRTIFVEEMMHKIFRQLRETVKRGEPVALATVIATKGSLPMSKRAKMLVFQNGTIAGTVGGGMLEAQVIQQARQVIATRQPQRVSVDLTAEQIEAQGLSCGGTVDIFVQPFAPDMNLAVIREIEAIYAASKTAVVATLIAEDRAAIALLREDGTLLGSLGGDALDVQFVEFAAPKLGQPFLKTVTFGDARAFLETILPTPTAFIFGGGHVAYFLAQTLHFIGFEYVVTDDRAEFLTRERFPHAKAFVCQNYDHICDQLDLHAHSSYVIIVTRGHAFDLTVLEQVVKRDVKYIGMIGSARKISILFDHLRQQGVSEEMLRTIHAPIGLKIGADTPEEIAISIAAELIRVRREE